MSLRKAHGPAIRAIREALGIPLNKCAKEVGINAGYLSRVERGQKFPTDAVIVSLAKRLGVEVDAITVPPEAVVTVTITRHDAA